MPIWIMSSAVNSPLPTSLSSGEAAPHFPRKFRYLRAKRKSEAILGDPLICVWGLNTRNGVNIEVKGVMVNDIKTQEAQVPVTTGLFADFDSRGSDVGKIAQKVQIQTPQVNFLSRYYYAFGDICLDALDMFRIALFSGKESIAKPGLFKLGAEVAERPDDLVKMPRLGPILLFLAVVIFSIALCSRIQVPL